MTGTDTLHLSRAEVNKAFFRQFNAAYSMDYMLIGARQRSPLERSLPAYGFQDLYSTPDPLEFALRFEGDVQSRKNIGIVIDFTAAMRSGREFEAMVYAIARRRELERPPAIIVTGIMEEQEAAESFFGLLRQHEFEIPEIGEVAKRAFRVGFEVTNGFENLIDGYVVPGNAVGENVDGIYGKVAAKMASALRKRESQQLLF
jgi:hypothetical protein